MKYNELSINERINFKSWFEHYTNEVIPRCFRILVLPQIFYEERKDNDLFYPALCNKEYPCTKETLLFRKNWHVTHPKKYLWAASPYTSSYAQFFMRPIL